MKIQKLLHSCLLIEENGKRILIDPGSWTFHEGALAVGDIPKIDAIFITHSHGDHCDPVAVKSIIARDGCPVYANEGVGKFLEQQGIRVLGIGTAQTVKVGELSVVAVPGAHGSLPLPVPLNNGFTVDGRVLHPGDCHTFEGAINGSPEVLAIPILAPWGTITEAMAIALRLKPKHVIPIHDGFIKEEFLVRMYEVCQKVLVPAGISFHALTPKDVLEI